MTTRIQLRRDTAVRWASVNPVLAAGEPAVESDTGKLKVGDGTSVWSLLPYILDVSDLTPVIQDLLADLIPAGYTDEQVRDVIGATVQGDGDFITVTANDVGNEVRIAPGASLTEGLAAKQDAATLPEDVAAHVGDGSALDVELRAVFEAPSVIAPRATGVAATDTAALQAAINSTPQGGRLWLPSTATPYALNAALTVTKSMTIEGNSISPVFTPWSTAGDPTRPVTAPYLAGTLIRQTVAATDIIQVTASAASVNLRRFGLLFADGLPSTGHGISGRPSLTVGAGHDMGLTGFRWDEIYVSGHDGNHYAFNLLNPQYGTLVQCHSYGGGGFFIEADAGILNSGNLVLLHPYSSLTKTGTAGGFIHSSGAGTPGTLNLITYIRPQCIVGEPAKTAGTQYMYDDRAGAAAPKNITLVAPNFESTGNKVRFGTDTAIVGSPLITGTSRPYPDTTVALGIGALPNPTGGTHTAVGYQALATIGDGTRAGTITHNTAVGYRALTAVTTTGSTAIGSSAAAALTTGDNAVAIGYGAMGSATTQSNQTAIGRNALLAGGATQDVAIGYQTATGLNSGTGKNTFVGASAGVTATPANATTGGDGQTCIGYAAGQASASNASRITVVGYNTTASGNYSTGLGTGAAAKAAGAVAIGADSGGAGATTTTANEFMLGTVNHLVTVPGRLNVAPRTPTSSADAQGRVGDIASDDNYVYVKTSTGWKRSALAAW